jgi:integrase
VERHRQWSLPGRGLTTIPLATNSVFGWRAAPIHGGGAPLGSAQARSRNGLLEKAGTRTVNRGAFSEVEVRAILNAARPRERALMALLVFTGMRPGEVYALDWQSIDDAAARINVRRTWDWKGKRYNPPKTEAGERRVPLCEWVLEQLAAHRATATDTAPEALVFSTVNREQHADPMCEQALALYEQGVSRKEISKRLGPSPARVSQYIWYAHRSELRPVLAAAHVRHVRARRGHRPPQRRACDRPRAATSSTKYMATTHSTPGSHPSVRTSPGARSVARS